MLERGLRGFNRRGLIEDLANALGCSVVNLTGQPYRPPDRESARAKRVIKQIERGLNEATLDDVPDLRPRTLDLLNGWVNSTAELLTQAAYRASVLATTFGYPHLAQLAAQRAYDAALITEHPALMAFAMFAWAPSVARTGGRNRAVRLLDRALGDTQQLTTIQGRGHPWRRDGRALAPHGRPLRGTEP